MKNIILGLLALLPPLTVVGADDSSSVQISKGLVAVPLITPQTVVELGMKLEGRFDVLDGRAVVVQSGQNLVDLVSEKRLLKKPPARLESFAFAPGGLLLAVSNQKLGYFEDGKIHEIVSLPYPDMQICPDSAGRLYLYGGKTKRHVIYLVDGNRHKLLAEFERPVTQVVTVGKNLYVASGSGVFELRGASKPKLIFSAPASTPVKSLAVDRRGRRLFISVGRDVCLLRNGIAKSIVQGLAGDLRYAAGTLFVFDARQESLLRITGLDQWRDPGETYSDKEVRRIGQEALLLQKAYLEAVKEVQKGEGSKQEVQKLREMIGLQRTRLRQAATRRPGGGR